jgi:hypothetical protein
MAAGANWTSLLPGRNPSGTTLASDYSVLPATGSSSGANPIIPASGLPVGATASNPYDPSSVVPPSSTTLPFGANTGGYTSTNLAAGGGIAGTNPVTNQPINNSSAHSNSSRELGELQKMYGQGLGSALYQFLSGGAGFNQDAINNLFASLQPGIERGTESLMEQFSTSGNRFGSGAQIGLADYLSQVNLNEGQLETQMYEQSIQNYLSVLLPTSQQSASNKNNSPSELDNILSGIGLGGSAAQGISQAISAFNPTADTSILDTIGSLAGAI